MAGYLIHGGCKCSSYMTPMFFHSTFYISTRLINVRLNTSFVRTGPFADYILVELSSGCISMDFRVLMPLKIACALVWQKILLNCSIRPKSCKTLGVSLRTSSLLTWSSN